MSPVTLTFTPGNWATAQTVTVEADHDDDAEDDTATVEHEVSGGDYGSNGVTAADVAVTVDDDETASAQLTLTVDPPSVAEDAGATQVEVTGRLTGAPDLGDAGGGHGWGVRRHGDGGDGTTRRWASCR